MMTVDFGVRRSIRVIVRYTSLCCAFAVMVACSLSDLVDNVDLPSNVTDPSAIKTEAGAIGAYWATIGMFAEALGNGDGGSAVSTVSYVALSGLFTDELTLSNPSGKNGYAGAIDRRGVAEATDEFVMSIHPYGSMGNTRGLAHEARGALQKYNPRAPIALQGHLFAIEGMTEVLLAEMYCSGIPLSTVDFEEDYTLTRGFSSEEVYRHALSLFDSADMYAADSVRIQSFSAIGRARALLALGRYEDAANAAAIVSDTFQYRLSYTTTRPKFVPTTGMVMGNFEGGNGLPFGSKTDPRTTLASLTNKAAPLVLASGVEARLIAAEAALAAGRAEWLQILNDLRTTCVSGEACPSPAPPGKGGVAGLQPLDDPGLVDPLPSGKDTMDVRVDLLFQERAYWLFLTGHRQGDLRRMVRQYGRPDMAVYPTGSWGAGYAYERDVSLPLHPDERKTNSLYTGCTNRDA